MFSRFVRPASCRKSASLGAGTSPFVWAIAAVCLVINVAKAHEGHDEVPTATPENSTLPRLVTKSDAYELVAVLQSGQLTIYLDRYEDNSPVTDANITVTIEGDSVAAERAGDGSYAVASKQLGGRGTVELIFDVRASAGDDLLIGKLPLVNETTIQGPSMTWYARAWAAARHGLQDHFMLLVLMLLVGSALGTMFRRHLRISMVLVVFALLVTVLAASTVHAHEGDHGNDGPGASPAPGDTAQRLASGHVFVPKPLQRILDIRTVVARTEAAPKSATLIGRVITDPNRSGIVQSINGGRVIAPSGGLPLVGRPVVKGEVLAEIERALQQSDRTTISEKSSEIEQLIATTEAKLRRLRQMAERGVALQSLVIEGEIELDGLRRRREVIRDTRIEPEMLRAPVDGVVAISRVVSGQVVQPQDLLFQIIDQKTLWVEAFDYGNTDPAMLKHATAIGAGNTPMELTVQGWSRTLQQQATVVQFAITEPPPSIRVGQPVTVIAQLDDTVNGVIVDRDAVVRAANGATIIWRHLEAEQFEPRPVRTEPFDAMHVLIAAGVADGDRVVVRGAELINQIR